MQVHRILVALIAFALLGLSPLALTASASASDSASASAEAAAKPQREILF